MMTSKLHRLALLAAAIWLPESLPAEKREVAGKLRTVDLGALWEALLRARWLVNG